MQPAPLSQGANLSTPGLLPVSGETAGLVCQGRSGVSLAPGFRYISGPATQVVVARKINELRRRHGKRR
jgi:hypothetical protein